MTPFTRKTEKWSRETEIWQENTVIRLKESVNDTQVSAEDRGLLPKSIGGNLNYENLPEGKAS